MKKTLKQIDEAEAKEKQLLEAYIKFCKEFDDKNKGYHVCICINRRFCEDWTYIEKDEEVVDEEVEEAIYDSFYKAQASFFKQHHISNNDLIVMFAGHKYEFEDYVNDDS